MSSDALQTALPSGELAAREERIRLTTAQAIVRFLGRQYSVRDGRRQRLVPAMLGIFGHGNVAGLGQALDEYQDQIPFVQGRNEPEGEVLALVGDGAFLMQPSELATAAQEGLKVTIVVSDNHGFQVIRRLQMNVTGRHFGNEMRRRVGAIGEGPLEGDYVQLDLGAVAAALGAQALSADTPAELRDALARARDANGPVVIVVPTEPHTFLPSSGAWWDVAPAEVSAEPLTAAKRVAYEEGLQNQRWFG